MHPQKKLKAANAIGSKGTKAIHKINDHLQTKSVFYSYTNKLDRLISNNKNKHKLTSLDLINQTTKDGTVGISNNHNVVSSNSACDEVVRKTQFKSPPINEHMTQNTNVTLSSGVLNGSKQTNDKSWRNVSVI